MNMQDIEQIKGILAVLMVGGKEHIKLFDDLRFWAMRNEVRINNAMHFNKEDADALKQEHARWGMLIDIFYNIAQEINLEKQNEQ